MKMTKLLSITKQADLGGDARDSFEQAFSNLAHLSVQDRCPQLIPSEIGFQVIDKNDDNTKAVGVFGFKPGKQLYLVPIFYNNGKISGHELLYLHDQNLFVPLKDAWVDFLLSKQPSILGRQVDRNLSQIGVMPPDISPMGRSAMKFGSTTCTKEQHQKLKIGEKCSKCGMVKEGNSNLYPSWLRPALPLIYQWSDPKQSLPQVDLPGFLKASSTSLIRHLFTKIGTAYPGIIRGFDTFYPGLLEELARRHPVNVNSISKHGELEPGREHGDQEVDDIQPVLAGRPPAVLPALPSISKRKSILKQKEEKEKQASTPGIKVKVINEADIRKYPDLIHRLSTDERETLLRARVIVKDQRDDKEITLAYNVETSLKLTNPTDSGIYEVLVKPDQFKRCLVITHPYDQHGRCPWITLVSLEGEHSWINIHPSHVYTTQAFDNKAFRDWYLAQPETDTLKLNTKYVLIGPRGTGTVPFLAREEYSSVNDFVKQYDVTFFNHCDQPRPLLLQSIPDLPWRYRRHPYYDEHWSREVEPKLLFTSRPGTDINVFNGTVKIPDGFRLIQLTSTEEEDKDNDGKVKASDPSPLQPGDLLDIQLALFQQTTPLHILREGKDVRINGSDLLTKYSALKQLIVNYGFREKTASYMLDQVEKKGHVEYRIKQAQPIISALRGGPNSPPWPEPNYDTGAIVGQPGVPSIESQSFRQQVPDLAGWNTDREQQRPIYPDPRSLSIAQQAAGDKQKELFDVSMLGSLLDVTQEDNIIDKWIPGLMTGVSNLGVLYFNSLWHEDAFSDRYSKSEMPDIQDAIVNTFEGGGDLLLRLKSKRLDDIVNGVQKVDIQQMAEV